MPPLPNAQLTHLGLYVHDMDTMVAFYNGLLGLEVSDAGEFLGKELTFLTRSVDEHHQLVMIKGRTAAADVKLLAQLSFRVDSLDDLRFFAERGVELGATEMEGRNHGNSWSIYFRDPEYNFVEMYMATPWQVHQPWRVALDLGLSDADIEAETIRLLKEADNWQPVEDWQDEMSGRLDARRTGRGGA